MTNDELKALCESNARATAANTESISELSRTIDALVVQFIRPTAQQAFTNAEVLESVARTAEANANGIAELRQSLERTVRLSDDMAAEAAERDHQIEADRAAWQAGFDTQLAEVRANRQRTDERFNAQLAEIRALGETTRALVSALATTNGRIDSLEKAS